MQCFKNKTYIITGASSGVGKNVAEYLTKQLNANVILIARRKEIIDRLADMLPGNNYAIEFDLTNTERIGEIFEILEKKDVYVDGLVYAAGIAPLQKLEDNEYDLMMETMKINVLSFAEMGKYMLQSKCVRNEGAVVAVSSIVSLVASNRQSAYASSKAMLNTYVKYFAKEALGKLRVNAVLPGAIETEMYQKLREQTDNFDEKMKRNYPLGVIPVDRISKLIVYLLSDDADFITGSLFNIDGGFLLK